MRKKSEEHGDISTVQIKLNSFYNKQTNGSLLDEFNNILLKTGDAISQIAYEAYILANFHITRLLNESKPLPEIDQKFFFASTSGACSKESKALWKDIEFTTTKNYYHDFIRPNTLTVPDSKNKSTIMNSLAREMATSATNHLVLNFKSRLIRYIRVKYSINPREIKKFLNQCFEQDTELDQNQKEIKDMLDGLNPDDEDKLKNNLSKILIISFKIMSYYDSLDPDKKKGVSSFTLLPMKGSYIGSFFAVDPTSLPPLLNLLSKEKKQILLNSMLANPTINPETRQFLLEFRLKGKAFNQDFQQRKDLKGLLWSTLFDWSKFETINRKFKYYFCTNGYAVTVYLLKPKLNISSNPEKNPKNDLVFDKYIGIDPGVNYLVSAYSQKENSTTSNEKGNCVQVSVKEIRHNSKMYQRKAWDVRLRKNNPEYQEKLNRLPSLKVVNLEVFKSRLITTLEQAESLFKFCRMNTKFKAWKFKCYRFGKKAYHDAVKKVVGEAKKPVVGFGDWSWTDGFLKGKDKPGIKRIKSVMKERNVHIEDIDEFRTSKCCSKCEIGDVIEERIRDKLCHQVVRCNNNECGVVWQRDVNASRNIFFLLIRQMSGLERPAGLKRMKRSQDE